MPQHCCEMMASQIASEDWIVLFEEQPQKYSIPIVMYCGDEPREYPIPVHDGGSSGIIIAYCPRCGAKLPPSRRDEIYSEETPTTEP